MLTPSDLHVTTSFATVLIGDREMGLMVVTFHKKSTPYVYIHGTKYRTRERNIVELLIKFKLLIFFCNWPVMHLIFDEFFVLVSLGDTSTIFMHCLDKFIYFYFFCGAGRAFFM